MAELPGIERETLDVDVVIFGAGMDPRGIAELMPDWLERGCPVESPVTTDAFWYLTETKTIKAPIMPPPLQNHGNYVISLGEVVRWLAPIVGEMGVDLFPEFAATRVLVENGKVVGVRTGDKGIDKNGQPKANYEPGVDVRAKLTILAEGPRGTLAKQLSGMLD